MNTMSIGALLDNNTRIGKEMRTAVKVAGRNFNNSSEHHQAFLYFQNPAQEFVREKNVQSIISLSTWTETALVASVGNQEKVPIISFAMSAIEKPIIQQHWPFLVQMAPDIKEQIKCITDIVRSFQWRKVIVIYEVDSHGSDSGAFILLSETLMAVGVEIEHRLVLPPFSSLSDPNSFVRQEVVHLLSKQARVFIVLKTSLELGVLLFKEAKELRLVQKDSAWIISDPLAGLLDSVNTSVISSMEDNSEPSVYALRAYDSVTAIRKAIKKSNSSTMFLETFLSTNFTGLSGLVSFRGGELMQPSVLNIVNVVGKRYKEVGVWSSKLGFSRSVDTEESREKLEEKNMEKCWSYSGFCIDIFLEVLKILEQRYPLPYEFIPFYGSYDEIVDCVANKTFDAVIGDITILANRSGAVEFTQPFTESGLTMVVTVKSQAQNKAWIFVQPFTGEMWAITGAILLYTVLIVWLLERQLNPEYEGRWWNQLNTALWFTCSSLFFAHREKVYNNYTRIVVLVWLFVVLALTSSYTANLSSLLTVPRLVPSVSGIQWLKDKNAKIGCDGDSFVRKYLENVLGFHPDNIKNISSQYDYPKEFESGNITAAFLELPYQKAFLNYYCEGYIVSGNTSSAVGDRFGGLGFVSIYSF
ncbi:hypothetical protein DH2020_042061 [Rehmannia glutinosa]|uniref:Ionotropic glutamate receptor C-terminal domain-containing protein n=1 Tax=Rehmannia glutinosa TaxID=99300 RepID=A0ABR0UQ17_REHGL